MEKYKTLDEQMEVVKKSGWNIHMIDRPFLQVQLEAVRQDRWNIKLIKNPHKEVQLYVKLNNMVV